MFAHQESDGARKPVIRPTRLPSRKYSTCPSTMTIGSSLAPCVVRATRFFPWRIKNALNQSDVDFFAVQSAESSDPAPRRILGEHSPPKRRVDVQDNYFEELGSIDV
jgi:hypothetical protein